MILMPDNFIHQGESAATQWELVRIRARFGRGWILGILFKIEVVFM